MCTPGAAMSEESGLYIGVDVGTDSARAGLFTGKGRRLAGPARRHIAKWTNPGFPEGSFEQSTEDIWRAVCAAVLEVCSGGEYRKRVVGIGFSATCSLAVVDADGRPVTVSPSRDPNRNVVLWQDHRAVKETAEINSLRHPALRYVGGALSPEMQPPKLLWLKRHLHDDCWKKAGHFFDLADYLTFRATGDSSRSLCCVMCKWTYVGHTPDTSTACGVIRGWNDSFWEGAGLGDLVSDGYRRIGVDILAPGKSVGQGLTQQSASDMGLCPGIAVATSLIDAHAGGVGLLGTNIEEVRGQLSCHVTSRLALIGGTSTCHMAICNTPVYVPGVWGPYYSAMLPGYYLSEGGQSTSGQLLEHILHSNSNIFSDLQSKAALNQCSVYEELERVLCASAHHLPHPSLLTSHLHIVPDFHGNRSPLSDPTIRGMISGQSMIHTVADLAVFYLAVVQGLAFGTRHIIDAMNTNGHRIQVILVCGGLRQNRLYLQAHADVTGFPVVLPEEEESVLLGAGMLAGAAAQQEEVSVIIGKMMSNVKSVIQPTIDPAVKLYYDKKYKIFLEMYRDQQKYASLMLS